MVIAPSGTKIKVAFSEQRRGVKLVSGTARFYVAEDKLRPFAVTTDPARSDRCGIELSVWTTSTCDQLSVHAGIVSLSISVEATRWNGVEGK